MQAPPLAAIFRGGVLSDLVPLLIANWNALQGTASFRKVVGAIERLLALVVRFQRIPMAVWYQRT